MVRRAACVLLCSAVVTACGTQPSGESAGSGTAPALSTEDSSCYPRGTGLVSVSATGKKPLSTASVNVIELRMDLAFAVTVFNGGCLPEKQIGVRLAISGAGQPVTAEGQIDQIDPGEEKTVVLGHLSLPALDEKLVLSVEIEPVPGETKMENNSAEYPVRFVVV